MAERSGGWISGFYFLKAILQYTARNSSRETHDEHCLGHHYLAQPMKSMMGETLSDADIGGAGLPAGRGWAVQDEKSGGIRGGKKIPQLMTLAAQSGPAAPLITAPDGDLLATAPCPPAAPLPARRTRYRSPLSRASMGRQHVVGQQHDAEN